jgi:MoxR-like ATPase
MRPQREAIDAAIDAVSSVLFGKERAIRLALCCLLARGHLLIEDLPGMGKTTLAHALARVLGLSWNRVQFTSDLLPADILGVAVYQRDYNSFRFHQGPVFTQLLLADEINRATPRTQSALLEAMAERQVSIEGETRPLPEPFFVIATQNPSEQSGTYPLPESQLDRFLMRIALGYPDPQAERALMRLGDRGVEAEGLEQVLSAEQLQAVLQAVAAVHTSEAVLDYAQRLVARTRAGAEFGVGLSPRGVLALLHAARTWAVMEGRDYLLPEDIQAVLEPVAAHRLLPGEGFSGDGSALAALLQQEVEVVR